MRLYIVLILTAVTMAFTTGYFALFLQGSYTPTLQDIVEINDLKVSFQKKVAPRAIVNFNSIYYSRHQTRLIDPLYSNPSDKVNKQIIYSSTENCFSDFNILVNEPGFEKVWIWEEFRCGKRSELPRNFYQIAPFIHPSGQSYAMLAFKLNKGNTQNRGWVKRHIQHFHVMELSELKIEIGRLGGIYDLLEALDYTSLVALSKGQGTILTKRFLLAKINYPGLIPILEYRFYDREDLDNFLRDSQFIVQNYKTGRPCFYRDGELCWDYNVKHVFKLANTGTIIFFLGLVIICGIIVRLLITKIRDQKVEEERKRLALQVLTHEFRTPITSLLLCTEEVSRSFEKLPEELQETFLRISSEIYRLQRLTEKSRNYLTVQKGKGVVSLNEESVPSIFEIIDEITYTYSDDYGDNFSFEFIGQDREVFIDVYWLQICLKNLIENAFNHGNPPVKIKVEVFEKKILIEVSDQGKCQFDKLTDITGEFVKGNKSSGSGLGMNIVSKIVAEMGGVLKFNPEPTTFTIHLNR